MPEKTSITPTEGDLKVWWIPQVPMPAFEVTVHDVATGKLPCDALADYDLFQLDHNVKPDYCNAGGIAWFHDGEWEDLDPDEEGNIEYYLEVSGVV